MAMVPTGQMQQPQQPGTWDQFKGLFQDPRAMQDLTANPMWNMGMGLLAHRYDDSINPFSQGILGGLQTSQAYQTEADKRKDLDEQQEMLQNFFDAQRKALEQQGQPGGSRVSQLEAMTSPSVQQGLMAGAIDPQNLDLYRRLAFQEILGM